VNWRATINDPCGTTFIFQRPVCPGARFDQGEYERRAGLILEEEAGNSSKVFYCTYHNAEAVRGAGWWIVGLMEVVLPALTR